MHFGREGLSCTSPYTKEPALKVFRNIPDRTYFRRGLPRIFDSFGALLAFPLDKVIWEALTLDEGCYPSPRPVASILGSGLLFFFACAGPGKRFTARR
jgi:hypothetical protein